MNLRARMVLARVAFVFAAFVACLMAWRAGGGAEDLNAPPRPDDDVAPEAGAVDGGAPLAPSAPLAASAAGAEGYEVALRLTEVTASSSSISPAVQTKDILGAHWRKMRPAWTPQAKLVTSIALRTSVTETQWSMPAGAGKNWAPDAKIWNLNEGSFDQRDALIATPPSVFTYRVTVPRGGMLTFSEGTVNAMHEVVVFSLTVTDAKGTAREVYRHRLPLTGARRWTDASCDLSAFAGQNVELRLATETAPATNEERLAVAKQREATRRAERERDRDGGGLDASEPDGGAAKEELLGSPGLPIALWGSPTLLARSVPRVPFNVVWIVVDALRPDVIATFHDDAEDAKKVAAPSPPLEALLPKVPGLTPSIDALAKRGVRFTNAYSSGSWTRPGTLAMLAGARSSELGLDTERWTLFGADTARFYASDPPLLPLMARRNGMSTHAFVNNYFMVGYAPVGVEMGFEHTADHRYRTRDTLEITRDATSWIAGHRDTRFFLFVNYNSPHEPYDPPPAMLERVPAPPAGPEDKIARLYMAEAAKDDAAIGVLMQAIADAGQRDRTIVVVTADHGETLSSAHGGVSALDHMPVRYHHAVSNYEETARIPILIVAPGALPEDRAVSARVRNVDLAPTIAELLGLEAHPRSSGRSLVPLAKGQKEKDERVVVTEGRGTRAVMFGRHRLLVREGLARTTTFSDHSVTAKEELYDLVDDPGERHDLAPSRADLVAEMRARLDAALHNVPVAGSSEATASATEGNGKAPSIHLRFAGGGGAAHRVAGTIAIGDAKNKPRSFTVEPVLLAADSLKIAGEKAEITLTTSTTAIVGFDIVVDPPTAPVTWDLYLDDRAWPDDAVFGGPYGLVAPLLRRGIASDEQRLSAQSPLLPAIDPRRDLGVFVTRERHTDATEAPAANDESAESAEEMARLLREWGYAQGSGSAR